MFTEGKQPRQPQMTWRGNIWPNLMETQANPLIKINHPWIGKYVCSSHGSVIVIVQPNLPSANPSEAFDLRPFPWFQRRTGLVER